MGTKTDLQQTNNDFMSDFSIQEKFHTLRDAVLQKQDDLLNCDLYIRTGVKLGRAYLDSAKLRQAMSDYSMDALMISILEMNSDKKLLHTEFRPQGIGYFMRHLDAEESLEDVFSDIISGKRPNSLDKSAMNDLAELEELPGVQRFMLKKMVLQAAAFVETVLKAN